MRDMLLHSASVPSPVRPALLAARCLRIPMSFVHRHVITMSENSVSVRNEPAGMALPFLPGTSVFALEVQLNSSFLRWSN